MRKKYLLLILGIIALALVIAFLGFSKGSKVSQKNDEGKIKIITTLFPLYDFAKNIGQDKVEVSLLLPPGVEAHSFEPKPDDIVKINETDIFIYTGEFMEPWAHDIIQGADKKVKAVDASVGIEMMKEEGYEHEETDRHESEEEHHHHDGVDPHIWLDFDNDKAMVKTITKALSEKDPDNANYYQQKSEEYQNKLSAMDSEYKMSLSSCASKEIVYGGHYAFGYLANRYSLKYSAAQGVSPDAEPTAQDLIELVEQIRKDNIKYVFYEELTTPKIAETLANETKAKMLFLNAAHNVTKEDFQNNISFLAIMQENLTNLKIGLQCSN